MPGRLSRVVMVNIRGVETNAESGLVCRKDGRLPWAFADARRPLAGFVGSEHPLEGSWHPPGLRQGFTRSNFD